MAKLTLYKNNDVVLTKDGNFNDGIFAFDNIVFDQKQKTLVREDNNFKYLLDFKNEVAQITLKEQDYNLDIDLTVTDSSFDDDFIEISYTIESENVIENKLVIFFD